MLVRDALPWLKVLHAIQQPVVDAVVTHWQTSGLCGCSKEIRHSVQFLRVFRLWSTKMHLGIRMLRSNH